jgi:hypothetical protein
MCGGSSINLKKHGSICVSFWFFSYPLNHKYQLNNNQKFIAYILWNRCFIIVNTNLLMLSGKVIFVLRIPTMNTLRAQYAELFDVESGGTCSGTVFTRFKLSIIYSVYPLVSFG